MRDACLDQGIVPGVWFTHGGNIDYTPADAAFAIAEHEGYSDHDGLMLAIRAEAIPNCPRAIVTNFAGLVDPASGMDDPARAKPIIDAGFECLTEAYLGDNPNATPDRLDYRAARLGWRRSAPVFGVWNAPMRSYERWLEWPGWSVYLAEHVL